VRWATSPICIRFGTGVVLVTATPSTIGQVRRELIEVTDGTATAVYTVFGELFFASSNDLYTQFQYATDPSRIVIDLAQSHVWDASTVAALDGITTKYAIKGKTVEIHGLNEASARMHGRLSGQLASH
jgi:sulfate permease, SulP family